jgi:hypothetical protein
MEGGGGSSTLGDDPSGNVRIRDAVSKAVVSGSSGALAMGVQVSSLMWLRTSMNYQYRHGTSLVQAFGELYRAGGLRRFYRGFGPALLQAPLCRFGDTAANAGVLAWLDSLESCRDLPIMAKTICASAAAAGWRLLLMPLDTVKIMMQIKGAEATRFLRAKIQSQGYRSLYNGTLAASGAALIGHFCWFSTYNALDSYLPKALNLQEKIYRSAALGFLSAVVSDSFSNVMYIMKTNKQAEVERTSYAETAFRVVRHGGLSGLFGRGLKTRMLGNGIQGIVFSVSWKLIDDAEWGKVSHRTDIDEIELQLYEDWPLLPNDL